MNKVAIPGILAMIIAGIFVLAPLQTAAGGNILFSEGNVDIKPQTCPNSLNVKSKGVLPVAILGTDTFDVADVDVSTLALEGVAPVARPNGKVASISDVATPFGSAPSDAEDCTADGPDGFLDLIMKFRTQDIVDTDLSSESDGAEVLLTLTGELLDGTPLEGGDFVVIIKKP
ncbi:MAG: hypothetical protein ACE5J2_07870 [Nitrososphaerales archaeon]